MSTKDLLLGRGLRLVSSPASARVTPLADGLTVVSLQNDGDGIAVCVALVTDPSLLSPAERGALLLDLTRRLRLRSASKGAAADAQSRSTNRARIVGDVALMCSTAPAERWSTLLAGTVMRLGVVRPDAHDRAIVAESQRLGQLPGFEIRAGGAATRLRRLVTLGPDAAVPSLAELASLPLGLNALDTDAIAPSYRLVVAVVGATGNRDVAGELWRAVRPRWSNKTRARTAHRAFPAAARQRSPRFSWMSAGADAVPSLRMGWVVAGRGDRDCGSFWLMKRLLARRIEAKLVRRDPTIQVEVGSDRRRVNSVFWIGVSNFDPQRRREVEAVVQGQTAELARRAPGRAEIQATAARARDLPLKGGEGPTDRAAALAMEAIEVLPERDSITQGGSDGTQISELARTYLPKNRSTEVLCVPGGARSHTGSVKRRVHRSSAPVRTRQSKARPLRRHRVVAGESLRILARRYHVPLAALIRLNHLARPDRLRPGQVILVPRAEPRRSSP